MHVVLNLWSMVWPGLSLMAVLGLFWFGVRMIAGWLVRPLDTVS